MNDAAAKRADGVLVARERLLRLLGSGSPLTDLAPLKGLSEAEWGEVLELAGRHSVKPILHRRLKPVYAELEVPEPVRADLRKTYLMSGLRNTHLYARLNPVLSALGAARIDVVALKGSHLAELVYEEVALRPMADVDLLVRSEKLHEATTILRSLGYGQGDDIAPGRELHQDPIDEHLHIAPFQRPGGPTIELHYAIEFPKLMGYVDVERLWSRAERAKIGGAEALVLSPEDLVVHLCTHAALHHGFAINLLHLCDLPRVINRYADRFDWTVFGTRARAWGAERSVLVTFALTERLLGWRRPGAAPKSPAPALLPTDFDVVDLAEKLILQEARTLVPSVNVVRLWGDAGLAEKAAIVWKRVFLSRAEMGFYFGVPSNSPKLFFLYPLRVWQTLKRQTVTVIRGLRKDRETIASIDVELQRARLVDWLGGR